MTYGFIKILIAVRFLAKYINRYMHIESYFRQKINRKEIITLILIVYDSMICRELGNSIYVRDCYRSVL